jgi:hypothetical protein
MKKGALLLIGLLLAAPAVLAAANICIWQFDPLDRYYEPDVGDSVLSSYGLQTTLSSLGHNCTTFDLLPSDLSGFDLVFVSLGWYRC